MDLASRDPYRACDGGATVNSLTAIAADIRREAEAAHRKAGEAVQHAKRAGELLIQAKTQIAHGGWLPWLAEHCHVSARQAQKYMRLAERWPELESKNEPGAYLTLTSALAAIAADDAADDLTPLYTHACNAVDLLAEACAFDGPTVSTDTLTALYADACSALAEARDRDEIAEHLEAGTITEAQAIERYAAQARNADLEITAATIRLKAKRWIGRFATSEPAEITCDSLPTAEQSIAEFDRVRRALTEIRDQRLYRETHATFEDYCRDKWGLGADDLALFIGDVEGAQA